MTSADASALDSLDLSSLRQAYQSGRTTPVAVAELVAARLDAPGGEAVWIHKLSAAELVAAARAVEERFSAGNRPPLYGVPFAVKDNIDVAGLPTTAACPAIAYTPASSATVVQKLLDAGAFLVGKTNMDQLATGLVGVRSPYGIPTNPFDPRYPTGGSSAGSAAAVARGQVSFALGTDTAGSGRVPAAFTNIVGLKPSRGLLSTAGTVPACRSLDCVSVFALSTEDAAAVADVARGHDPGDPWSRPEADRVRFSGAAAPARHRLGVLPPVDREFFSDPYAERLYAEAITLATELGAEPTPVPLAPFREAAALLYEGAWVAERLAPFEELLERPGALLPVIAEIIGGGRRYSGAEVFRAVHRLEALRQQVRALWRQIDALLLPTTPTIYTIAQINSDPIRLNARLGIYTNFVNLLDLAAVAVPTPIRGDGLPSGVTFIGPRDSDARLAALASRFHRAVGKVPGTSRGKVSGTSSGTAGEIQGLQVAVVGAHLSGEPLNWQLTEIGARLVRTTRTSPVYRLYALPDTNPPKPGLVRVASGGAGIEIEIWDVPTEAFGGFFARVGAPLSLGTVVAEDGEAVKGFLCEAVAVTGARDISDLGGWRRFVHG
jgi:allophanate hydrolase